MLAFDWDIIFTQTFSQAFGTQAVVFALAAIGLNIHFGYAGLLNFGQVGFMAAGAYGVGMSVFWFDIGFWPGLIVGVLYCLVLALLLGIPTLRLRADYLAITTIAASESIRLFVRWRGNRERTGAAEGIGDFADPFYDLNIFNRIGSRPYRFLFFEYRAGDLWVMLVGWTVVGLCLLLTWQLMRSPWGRVLKAIREDEDAARALGKNAYSSKLQALAIAGALPPLGGMLQAVDKQSVQPDTFNPVITFMIWTVLIIGGAGRVWSPVVGAMLFWGLISGLEAFMRELLGTGLDETLERFLNLSIQNVSQVKFMVFGLVLMLLMRYRPQGIFGSREEMALDDR
ncbi:MAG: branched-chain amino acid ABC transporter permease [Actinomycetia bacterium]|nr:branched-chain amino acid ABC transporter permease [Actinomycetes bacterium]